MQKDPEAAEGFFLKALEIDSEYASASTNLTRLRQQRAQQTPENH
jgi:hypothetical protein